MPINPKMSGSDAPIARPRPKSAIRFKGDDDALDMDDYRDLMELGITPGDVVGLTRSEVVAATRGG